jgi:NAD(P)-dependent dehydrogenase (short-subunit alcohol dehydrogenase family)
MSKTILITGTSSGFGRADAEIFAEAGHRVFGSMIDPNGRDREHADALRAKGIDVVALDVRSDSSVDRAVAEVLTKAGRVDVLVNNAGTALFGVTESFTSTQVQMLFDINVVGPLRVARAVLPGMRRQRDGLIINIGSILGRVTFPFFGLYGASKFAVEAMTDSLRYEVSQFGVDVVLVQPSAHPTSMYASAQKPLDADRVASYGAVGEIPAAMLQHFATVFQSAAAPDPREVPKALVKLIDLPKGARPARTVVGESYGADIVNEKTQRVQQQTMEALGLAHLGRLA